jgi:ADP-ribose pyrophosphatase YjhB (NUDIX family)
MSGERGGGSDGRPGAGRGPDGRSTDVPAGSGPPTWLSEIVKHCGRCGGPLALGQVVGEDRERLACATCGHVTYLNPRLVATTIPVTDAGEIVLIRRGIEPGRGLWAQPGGFLEIDETPTEGAARETLEETGLIVEPERIVGLYARLEASVVVLVYEARITGGVRATSPETLDVRVFDPEAIPWQEIAFRTTWWALVDWLALRRPDVPVPDGRGWT